MDYNQLLSYDLSSDVLCLLGGAMLAAVLLLAFWLPYVARPGRRVAESDLESESGEEPRTAVSGVSVIVYACSDGEYIESLLTSVLNQRGVSDMEVIVVNDGAADATRDTVGRLEQMYPNLYMTYAPANSRNLSRRKLALTLGIKAARYDKLVFTVGSAVIGSDRWLHEMTLPLARGEKVVLGYAWPDADGRDRGAKRVRSFDAVWEAVSWLSPALAGDPVRGIGANLAYNRSLFFENKGFSQSLNLVDGDDDIFVREITRGCPTAVRISTDAQVGVRDWNPARAHAANKLSRRFTGKRLPSWPRIRLAAGSWCAWGVMLLGAAAGVLGWPSAVPAAAALLILLSAWIPVMIVWRRTARALHSRPLLLTVWPLLLWHPFYNLYYRIRGMRNRGRNFTWSTNLSTKK